MNWIIFSKDQLWLDENQHIPNVETLPFSLPTTAKTRTMMDESGEEYTVAFVEEAELLPEHWNLMHLRSAFEILSRAQYRMVCKLKELLHWDEAHQFCGHCGHFLETLTEISKKCPNCGREEWPSPSPAMIVLVEKPSNDGLKEHDEVLMIRTHNFPGSFHSLVAGYVESGEALEETVVREVKEETGIEIKDVTYVASQSWPFPFVQMIGFRATYAGGTLRFQEEEIERGGWFRRDGLPELPGKISLARQMIDCWLEE